MRGHSVMCEMKKLKEICLKKLDFSTKLLYNIIYKEIKYAFSSDKK